MTLPSDRLQLLFDRHLEFMVKLRTQLLDHQCFAYASEVDGLINEFHAELENDHSLHESSTSRNSNETAVSQETPGCPALSISETCPVVDSNTTIPELAGPNSDAPSSQQHDAMSNAHEIDAVPAHEEMGSKSSSILNTEAPNEIIHDTKNFSNESNDQNYLIVLPDPDYFADSYVPVQISYKNVRKISNVLNDNQESNTTLIDTDYPNDSLSTNEVPREFKETISEESNVGDLESNVIDPHDLVSSNAFPVKCDKHIALIVTWLYEDPTVFRGGGWIREI
ncbi:unnamed protein product [Schistosoma rodhaini]|nr:unnamed protein product [Schistosoma rodhaini]